MKVRYAATVLAVFFLMPAAQLNAQGGGAAQAPAEQLPSKVGIVNFRSAIFATAEGKRALAELQSEFTPRRTEIENLSKQIDDAQKRLQAGERTLSDEEKSRLIRQGQQWARLLQRKQDNLQEDANQAQQDLLERIGSKMYDLIEKFAQENGFSVILDYSAQSNPVLFGAAGVDVTQDIIRLYDQAHPVQASTPAPAQTRPAQPGQTRPAQPPPPPQS